jgi:ABC-type molybdate transport system permease subunit
MASLDEIAVMLGAVFWWVFGAVPIPLYTGGVLTAIRHPKFRAGAAKAQRLIAFPSIIVDA